MSRLEDAWTAWLVVDSAFPTGAFAHSGGLEAAWQQGEVADADALERFLAESIRQAGYGVLPLLNAAYARPDQLAALNDLADAFLLNSVANRASRVQARTLVATAARVWPSPALDSLQASLAADGGHVAPVSGVVLGLVGLSLETVQRVVLYGVARGVLSAAVRLGIAGSFEAQRMQAACGPLLDRVLRDCGDLREADLTQTAPLIDLLQAGHDRLYSRLFQS
jgi:urease accessory protein